jgi:hypothetical protein
MKENEKYVWFSIPVPVKTGNTGILSVFYSIPAKAGIYIFLFFMIIFSSCENLFAPRLDNTNSNPIITDQKTIEGVFQNFRYSYAFKDTSVYSDLLTPDFIFTYRDYVSGFDVSWDKPTDMKTTSGLFANSQKVEVIWNNIVYQSGDTINYSVKRSFNLTITFNPSDIVRIIGFVDMSFKRTDTNDKWRILKWRDESF